MSIANNGLPDIILSSLERGDFVYLHPSQHEGSAYFGRYIGVKFGKVRDYEGDCVSIKPDIDFKFSQKYRLWIPDGPFTPDGTRLNITMPQIMGDFSVSSGENIKEFMEKNNNPNYGLVDAIMKYYQKV